MIYQTKSTFWLINQRKVVNKNERSVQEQKMKFLSCTSHVKQEVTMYTMALKGIYMQSMDMSTLFCWQNVRVVHKKLIESSRKVLVTMSGSELNSSLTSMDWLSKLNGGGLIQQGETSEEDSEHPLGPKHLSLWVARPTVFPSPAVKNEDSTGEQDGDKADKEEEVELDPNGKPPYRYWVNHLWVCGWVWESTVQLFSTWHCSYATLIRLAISNSPTEMATLSGIYDWIADKYPYYRSAGTGWKVRSSTEFCGS